MLKRLPQYLLGKDCLAGTVTFTVLFALIFLTIYIPFSNTAWFGFASLQRFLFTAGFVFISILILVASRAVMYRVSKKYAFTYLVYVLWCFFEVLLLCGFYTFVTVDIVGPARLSAMQVFSKSFFYGVILLLFPYALAGMYFVIVEKNRTIRRLHTGQPAFQGGTVAPVEDKLSLYDSSGVLKLSVRIQDLYFMESDDNYVKVWYTDTRGEMKTYMLRSRLKSVEQSLGATPLVRCHRKYIVNLERVKVLRKEKDLYCLELDCDGAAPLPVSKTYAPNVLSRFMKDSPEKVSEEGGLSAV